MPKASRAESVYQGKMGAGAGIHFVRTCVFILLLKLGMACILFVYTIVQGPQEALGILE